MDMDLKGSRYTWVSNPRNGVVTKQNIDRVLVNVQWRILFPHAYALALPMISSDHSPIILDPAPNATSGRRFKFESFWQEHPEFDGLLNESWRLDTTGQDC